MADKNTNCKDCNGKGYYSQMLSLSGRGDFEALELYETKNWKIACPTCNFRNKLKLDGVRASQYFA